MKILTFYNNIEFAYQDECISMWKNSWSERGFEPIVVDVSNSKEHPYFEEFSNSIKEIHEQIMDRPIDEYGLACYYRWLAYSVFLKNNNISKSVFVCDYDVINSNLTVEEASGWLKDNEDKLYFYHGCTPCLVSGNSSHFESFCKKIISISNKNLDLLKCTVPSCYHDQEFLVYNRSDICEGDFAEIDTQRHSDRLTFDFTATEADFGKYTLHFSHAFCDHAMDRLNLPKDQDINKSRIDLIRKFFEIKNLIKIKYKSDYFI